MIIQSYHLCQNSRFSFPLSSPKIAIAALTNPGGWMECFGIGCHSRAFYSKAMESQQHEMYVKSQKNTRLSMLYWPNNRWILEILENTSQVLKSKMQKRQIPRGHRDPPKCPPKSFKSTSSTLGSFSKLGTHTAKTSWNSGDESSFISPMMGEGHRISEFI